MATRHPAHRRSKAVAHAAHPKPKQSLAASLRRAAASKPAKVAYVAIGTVGLSEQQARAQGFTIDIYRANFRPMKHTLSGREERVLVKLVVDRVSNRVLGAHMLGNDGPEIVQGLAVALNCGATKADFDRTIGLHPSAAEEFVTLRDKVGG